MSEEPNLTAKLRDVHPCQMSAQREEMHCHTYRESCLTLQSRITLEKAQHNTAHTSRYTAFRHYQSISVMIYVVSDLGIMNDMHCMDLH